MSAVFYLGSSCFTLVLLQGVLLLAVLFLFNSKYAHILGTGMSTVSC